MGGFLAGCACSRNVPPPSNSTVVSSLLRQGLLASPGRHSQVVSADAEDAATAPMPSAATLSAARANARHHRTSAELVSRSISLLLALARRRPIPQAPLVRAIL